LIVQYFRRQTRSAAIAAGGNTLSARSLPLMLSALTTNLFNPKARAFCLSLFPWCWRQFCRSG